ncbi:hypothetical protein Nizo2264_2432 [Lactiplantibacillus plantarum]|nr:hypothetical protein SF2A35B_2183 [Lactiplantibacillus plantarum]KZU11854.1 hypothetical protein Nizo2264_2432 [Lactiplantibacillus plantarum]
MLNGPTVLVLITRYNGISVSDEMAELKRSFACDGMINPV